MFCLVTRIEMRKLSTLVGIMVAYLRMRQRAKRVPGLIEMALLIRPRRTVLFVSLWEDTTAMAKFNTAVPEHPVQVRRMRQAGARTWSGMFELTGTSRTARVWPGLFTDTEASVEMRSL